MNKDYDFCGWATKNDLLCSDGRTIKHGAFSHQNGMKVPLVWNHMHSQASNILGYGILREKDEGMRVEGYFNNTQQGKDGKEILMHGDIGALSICATKLTQDSHRNVLHGDIKEVSLVISPANPGAWIDDVVVHSDTYDDEIILYTGEPIELMHAESKESEEKKEEPKEETKESKETEVDTVGDLLDALKMNDEQKKGVYAIVGGLLKENEEEELEHEENEEEFNTMKHNVFESEINESSNVLTHSDELAILEIAKKTGSFQDALAYYMEENDKVLMHGDVAPTGGFVQPPTEGNVTTLFPEYKDVRPGAPEIIRNDNEWVTKVLNKVHKSPLSRIRVRFNDIRDFEEDMRAKGYIKGTKKKLTGQMAMIYRTVDPQTIYVKNALNRDDIIDITDFDYTNYLYGIDRSMYEMELARAILIGDGREVGDEDKIKEDHIRPIWTDDDLFTIHADLDVEAVTEELQGTDTSSYFGKNFIMAEAMVNTCLYAREKYKGTGSPDMYITPHMLNVMLLARDRNGRRIYSGVSELATALNVNSIVTVEQFADKTRTVTVGGVEKTKKLLALMCNLSDYTIGATKGGQLTHFTQFDIDFNQEKSLLEGRQSGMLTRPYSAIAIEEEVNF